MNIQQNMYRRTNIGMALANQVNASGAPSVSLRSFIQPVSGIALASFNVIYSGSKNPVATASALEHLFNGELTVIPGSMREIAKASNGVYTVVTARLTGKQKTLFIESGSTPDGFTSLSKNLFMDGEEQMWDLQSTNGRTVLVRKDNVESNDALESLLARFAPVTAGTIKAADELIDTVHSLANSLEAGTLVSYVHPVNRQVKLGFILECSGDHVQIAPELGSVEDIPLSLLTNGFNADSYANQLRLPKAEACASGTISTKEALISYYRQIFGMNESYFQQWTRALQAMSL